MRQAKRLQRSSYTVGWICALPLEMAAAKAMLDERHEQLPQSSRDGNSYALGEIFGHNIVIACLPSGQYGTETAATVSAQMWSAFPCIQFYLMVGVGGGVPTDIDIRLGDVVVSKPTGLYGGVFQYDQGKSMPNGRFVHTGSLNRPPQKLLAAVADLQSDHMMGTSRIPEFFLEVKARYPNMSDFLHPTGEDCLFQADYEHEHEGLSCANCDKTKLIVRELRPSRSPRIHYGLIASGSQVMKDAFCRDRLAKEHGIICFEMEAAGVMNNSPCLVIRGICDYADSHKSKGWQCYAALAAAAYAKELLAVMQDEPRVGEVSTSGDTSDSGAHDNYARFFLLSQRPEWQIVQHDGSTLYNIFDRLSSYDPVRICRNYLDRKCPNTASWISNNVTFKKWLSQDGHPCLWLTGKIGCGKTFATSSIIQLLETSQQQSTTLVAHFFFSHTDRTHLKAIDVFESYTKQILGHLALSKYQCPERIVTSLKRLYGPGRWPLSLTEMVQDVFFPVCRLAPNTIFIVDGLDECERPDAIEVLDVFRVMASGMKTRILISGREGLEVVQLIPASSSIIIADHGNGSDILRFIDWKMDEKMRHRTLSDDPILLQEIRQRLAERADQMFLWVSLQLDMMWEECYTDSDIKKCLENLPKDLSETYRRCISRINQRHSGLAYKMLFWVCVATKPFTIPQMQEALAMDQKTGLSEQENSMPAREVLKLCSHLVIQDTDGKLRPTHYSVNQFLAEASGTTNTASWADRTLVTAKKELGQLCVVHLLSPIYQRAVQRYKKADDLTDGRGVLGTIQKHVPYAWLLRPTSSVSKPLRIPWPPNVQPNTTVMKPPKFFSFARDNWVPLMDWIDNTSTFYGKFRAIALDHSFSWKVHPWESIGDSFESHMVGLMGWAIANKHSPLFELMRDPASPKLHREVFNIPLYHYNNMPLLHLAARMDFSTAVEELAHLSKPRLLDHNKRLAIHHAAETGSVMAMRVLLQSMKAYVNDQDIDGYTPLHLAALNNRYAIVDTLLNCSKIAVDLLDIHRRTPLFYALEHPDNTMVEALLHMSAFVNSRDAAGQTPVFVAAARLNDRALELLIQRGANVHALDKQGYQPLHFAASSCLQLGTHRIARGMATAALIKSIKDGNNSALRCLLQAGANPDGDKRTHEVPIMVAVQVGNCYAVDLLTEAGAAIDTYNGALKHTPLSLAYHLGYNNVVDVLRRRGASMEYRLILQAARLGQSDVVRLLVEDTEPSDSMSMSEPDELDHRPLHRAKPTTLASTTAITLACFQNHPEVITALVGEYCFRPDTIVSTLLNHNETLAKCILKGISKSDYQPPQLLLAIAAGSGAVQVVNSLLDSISVPDSTALVAAISMKFIPTIQVLLQRGAPIGLRVVECALESGLIETATILLNSGAALEQVYFDPPERGRARKDTIDETRGKYDLSRNVEDLIRS